MRLDVKEKSDWTIASLGYTDAGPKGFRLQAVKTREWVFWALPDLVGDGEMGKGARGKEPPPAMRGKSNWRLHLRGFEGFRVMFREAGTPSGQGCVTSLFPGWLISGRDFSEILQSFSGD